MRCLSAVLLAALVPACFHTDLEPVSAAWPAVARGAAYNELRPVAQEHTITITTTRTGTTEVDDDALILGNGETITHADDLLPVVPPQSPTARAAQRSADARGHKITAALLGSAAGVVGTFLMLDSIASETGPGSSGNELELNAGAGLAIVGTLVGYGFAWYFQSVEHRERRAAFATYDDGLRAQLNLCVDGLNVVACEAMPAPSN